MAWPSGTKASTNNVDQGGDKISLARADIKQNIDNTNDIIDTFNISSPSDGDLLQYSSSSGKWEQVSSTSIGENYAIFRLTDPLNVGSSIRYTGTVTIDYNKGLDISVTNDSAGQEYITLGAGTYILESLQQRGGGTGSLPTVNFQNTQNASVTYTEFYFTCRQYGSDLSPSKITLASQTNLWMYTDLGAVNAKTTIYEYYLKISKIA